MTAREQELLENILDALDRLFDRQSTAVDIWALLFATCEALRATDYHPELEQPLSELQSIVKSELSPDAERDRALAVTNGLRHYLAEVLPFVRHGSPNPRL